MVREISRTTVVEIKGVKKEMKPATGMVNAIFGGDWDDGDLSPSIHNKLLETIEGIKSTYKNGKPKYTDRHCRVLLLRFGFEDGRVHSLREIGEELNISSARVGQILNKSLRMLRHPSRSQILKGYIL